MRILIVDDEFTARRLLKKILSKYGDCDVVFDGEEAVQAFRLAWDEKEPYDLICLDIMMPNLDGQEVLKKIREMERERKVKAADGVHVIMMSALGDPKNVVEAYFKGGATSYLVKPIDRGLLNEAVRRLGLVT